MHTVPKIGGCWDSRRRTAKLSSFSSTSLYLRRRDHEVLHAAISVHQRKTIDTCAPAATRTNPHRLNLKVGDGVRRRRNATGACMNWNFSLLSLVNFDTLG